VASDSQIPPAPGAKAKRERNPDETRRRILDAAEREFANKGYDGSRLRDVAVSAGVHHALLHHYYRDKEGLFAAVIERALDQVSTRAWNLIRSTTDIRLLIEGYVDTIVDYYADYKNLISIVHLASLDEGSPAFALCEEVMRRTVMPLMEAATRTLERAQKQGAIRRDIDARRMVALAMSASAFIYQEHRFFEIFLGEDVRADDQRAAHKAAVLKILLGGALAADG
jgi:AcrR family transcriptional regulator